MNHTRLGQHFLTRPEIAGWVADAIPLGVGNTVLEIGPGRGILTRELLKRADKVVAVEKDRSLVAELSHTFETELREGRLHIIKQDVRDFDATTCPLLTPRYTLIANIPYYLSGYIIRTFLSAPLQPENMSLLVQKEVAERIVARGGKESLLSLSVKVYGTPHYVETVKAGSFSPPPKVHSAVLAITNISRLRFANAEEEARFFTIIRAGFASKRKVLSTNLASAVSPAAFTTCQIPKSARAEDLTLDNWFCLARAL